jgi:peptidoglycan/xylan/chitin deacetylase (PgdA/CDA1 family)
LRIVGGPLGLVVGRLLRRSGRRIGAALVYHRVGDPPGELERELVPALGSSLFAAQLRHLSSEYRLVAASELPRAVHERRRGERLPVAITFDDDLRSHVEVAAPLLRGAGAPATFFLTGASLRAPHQFWWERLQTAVDRGLDLSSLGLPGADETRGIHQLGQTIEMLTASERDEIDAELGRLVGPDPSHVGLRSRDVERLAREGFEIGFHTQRHDPLPGLTGEELERAMRDGRPELERLAGKRMGAIAYPHGRADARVAAAARAAGFELGFTGSREVVRPESDPLLLGRVSPSYESVGALALGLAWVLFRSCIHR